MMSKKAPTRARSYCYTLNNPTEDEIVQMRDVEAVYHVFGHEVGESGTPHLQGFLHFENARSLSVLKKKVNSRAHYEIMKGTHDQAIEYCMKEGNYEEFGERPEPGKRSDIVIVRELVAEGCNMRDIVDKAPSYQGIRIAEVLFKYKEKPRNWKPEVSWFYGLTGTGKSRQAYQELPDAYTCMDTARWLEGYDGHEDVIIDDMRGDFCKLHVLLRLLDRYEMRVECKGGSRQFLAKRIIITSCSSPSELFSQSDERIDQLLRRIDRIIEFTPGGQYVRK